MPTEFELSSLLSLSLSLCFFVFVFVFNFYRVFVHPECCHHIQCIPISRTLDFSHLPISLTNFVLPWINFSVILLSISRTSRFLKQIFNLFPWINFSVIVLSISPTSRFSNQLSFLFSRGLRNRDFTVFLSERSDNEKGMDL